MSTKRNLAVTFVTAGVTAGILATAVGPAAAQGNPVGGKGSVYFVSGALNIDGQAQQVYAFGNSDDEVLYGDWYDTGEDQPMVRRGNAFILPEDATTGNPNRTATTFIYGDRGDTILVGDWDGDGTDTLAVRRGNHYLVKNDFLTGKADADFYFGDAGDKVLVGNWNGTQPGTAGYDYNSDGDYVDPAIPARAADVAPIDDDGFDADKDGDYTDAGDRAPGTGVDNNKDGDFEDTTGQVATSAEYAPGTAKGDTLMIQRGNQFFVRNTNTTGNADYTFYFGNAGDSILVGDWATAPTAETKTDSAKPAASGDGADQLAVQRGNQFFKSSELEAAREAKKNPTTIESLYYGDAGDTVFVAARPSAAVDAYGKPAVDDATTLTVDESDDIVGDGFGVRR